MDHRDRISGTVLERIERRLELIERQLTAVPNCGHIPPQNQGTPEPERSRRKGKSTKSDPMLRVGLQPPIQCDSVKADLSQQFVRTHTALLLGIKNLRSDPVPDPPGTEETEHFDQTKRGGPSNKPGTWRPDLSGPRKSTWNKAAVRRFCRSFLKADQYGKWTPQEVEKAVFVHMDTLRARYKDQTGQRSKDEYLKFKIKAARASRLRTVSS